MEVKMNDIGYAALKQLDKAGLLRSELSPLVENLLRTFLTTRFPSTDVAVRLVILIVIFITANNLHMPTSAIRRKLENLGPTPLTRRDAYYYNILINPFVERYHSVKEYAQGEIGVQGDSSSGMRDAEIESLMSEEVGARCLEIGCKMFPHGKLSRMSPRCVKTQDFMRYGVGTKAAVWILCLMKIQRAMKKSNLSQLENYGILTVQALTNTTTKLPFGSGSLDFSVKSTILKALGVPVEWQGGKNFQCLIIQSHMNRHIWLSSALAENSATIDRNRCAELDLHWIWRKEEAKSAQSNLADVPEDFESLEWVKNRWKQLQMIHRSQKVQELHQLIGLMIYSFDLSRCQGRKIWKCAEKGAALLLLAINLQPAGSSLNLAKDEQENEQKALQQSQIVSVEDIHFGSYTSREYILEAMFTTSEVIYETCQACAHFTSMLEWM
ncbi:hypothetical protein BYT27DRAFT_7207521 [Phlegmacium glaucopus]|nr:hypothetical protein BYT27DRAFT_7207521 [Phlegmacium glaucopus]